MEQKQLTWVFWAGTLENLCHVWNQRSRIADFGAKKRSLNLGPKVSYLDIFGLKFNKTFVIFEIDTLNSPYFQNSAKKQRWLNLGSKMPCFGIFELEFENNIVEFEISPLEFV